MVTQVLTLDTTGKSEIIAIANLDSKKRYKLSEANIERNTHLNVVYFCVVLLDIGKTPLETVLNIFSGSKWTRPFIRLHNDQQSISYNNKTLF